MRTLLIVLFTGAAASAQLSFSDQTDEVGLTFFHMPAQGAGGGTPMIAGGTAADFDGDGWQDLFVIGGGGNPDALFINTGDGTFTDQATAWNLDYAHLGGGSTAGDYDNDGELDLFVSSQGPATGIVPGMHRLYHNDGGSFSEVAAAAGVSTTSTEMPDGFGAAFGDMDLDGDLDLMTAGWFLASGGNRLFENLGDGTFDDVTTTLIAPDLTTVRGFSPRFMDMDGDRYPELLIAADFGTSRYLQNIGGQFVDATATSGTGQDSNGMGQAIGDLDGDRKLDWYVTSIHWEAGEPFSGNMCYRNEGAHEFEEESVLLGINDGGWGWGTVAVDFDHDGDVDLVENNGWRDEEWSNEQAKLFLKEEGGQFTESAVAMGLSYTQDGLGVLHFDSDNDGDQDLVFFANAGAMQYFEAHTDGPDMHWLRVVLDDGDEPGVAPDGNGAQLFATAGDNTQIDALAAGGSYLAQSELVAHFGLGASTVVDELQVRWPDGTVTYVADVATDQTLTVTCCTGWKDLGNGLAGASGTPELTGSGPVIEGGAATLDLAGGVPDGPAFLVLGFSVVNAPFKDGILVPTVDVMLALTLDGAGAVSLPFTWPELPPESVDLFWQFWLPDASGPAGWSASNGVRART